MKTILLEKYAVSIRSDLQTAKTILISFKSSWGEVDSILPVLSLLKRTDDIQIVAFFSSKRFFESDTTMPFLDRKVTEIADVVIRPIRFASGVRGMFGKILRKILRRVWWRDDFTWLFTRVVDPGSIALLMEPVGPIRPVQKHLRAWCTGVPVMVFQHSTALLLSQPGEESVKRDGDKPADVMLYSSPFGLENLQKRYPTVKQVIWTGFPRYDRWWIDEVLQDPSYQQSEERQRAADYGPVFAFFTTHIREDVISSDSFAQLVHGVAETVFSYPESFLVIKPHPRLKGNVLEKTLRGYPRDRWMISGLPALQIGDLADLVISMPSSTMLDNVVMKKPVIEFFNYTDLSVATVFQTEAGDPCTEYVYAGYVSYARDADDLSRIVSRFLVSHSETEGNGLYARARDELHLDNISSERSAAVIRDCISQRSAGV